VWRLEVLKCFVPVQVSRWSLALFAVVLSASVSIDTAFAAGKRVAFVVGNGAYEAVPQLSNPKNDAKAVSEALRRVGFEVVTAIDLDRKSLDAAMQTFIRSLSNADLSLFYYSGHGVEVGGENRIIPIDARLATEASLEVETISLQTIMLNMRNNSHAQLLYLDACRDNPFPVKKFVVGADEIRKSVGRGLAKQNVDIGSLIAYATEPGNIALDGDGANSPFTSAVLRHSFAENIDVQTALMQVTRDVWEATNEKQRPWSNATLVEPIFLNGLLVKSEKPAEVAAAVPEVDALVEATPVKNAAVAAVVEKLKKNKKAGTKTLAVEEVPRIAAEPEATSTEKTDVASIVNKLKKAKTPAAAVVEATVAEVAQKSVEIAAEPSTVGIGAQAIFNAAEIASMPAAETFKLAATPSSGTVSLEGQTVISGQEFDAAALAVLKFEPSISAPTTPPSLQLEATMPLGDVVPVVVSQTVEVNACDVEAAEPLDLQGTQRGTLPNEISVEKALTACRAAVKDHPDVPRFAFELGRAELGAKNIDVAHALFTKAAEAGYMRAFNQLGYMAQRGIGQEQNLKEANGFFKQGAKFGDPYAMLSYGRNLARGRGVKQDVTQGVEYLNRAVEMGHTYAMNELGSMYLRGDPVKQNAKRAVRFFEASMNRGDIYGIQNMAVAYLTGEGVEKDEATALALFTAASKGGHPYAATNIGAMYFNGTGVKKNLEEAIKWYEIGAERGSRPAAANLGWIYSEGPKQKRDVVLAVQFTALAAALDTYKEDKSLNAKLANLPESAKSEAVKNLIKTIGPENLVTAEGLDETLILLSRKAWQLRNPRLDLF
jgi:TPR repeat protein/uncharacterized caspase-like protein